MSRAAFLSLALLVTSPAVARAKANPWAFDFDPNITKNPGYVNKKLKDLAAGLPPLVSKGIVELKTGKVKLYLFAEISAALLRAKTSGPGKLPPLVRKPTYCVAHAAFRKPALLVSSPSARCLTAEKQTMAAFSQKAIKTCYHVEFPETFAYEHAPVGYVDFKTVSTLERLISFAGEALTHVDYPTGLLPKGFYPAMRSVIAKLRFSALKRELSDRLVGYQRGLAALKRDSVCFRASALASFAATVNKLIGELKGVANKLNTLYNAGLAQAQRDRKAVEAQGRARAALPHPALTDRERELLAFYIGGLYWRMRGAGLIAVPPDPGQGLLRRLLYVQYPYQLIGELTGGFSNAKDVGLNVFIQENWGYADWMDMGTTPGNDKYADLVEMTNRGKVATALVAPSLAQRGFDTRALITGGLQMGPCYYYAWEELRNFKLGPNLKHPYMQFLEIPTATGEFCTGAALALGLARTMLWGKPGPPCRPSCAGKRCGEDDGCGRACGGACAKDAGADGQPRREDGALPRGDGVGPGDGGEALDAAVGREPAPRESGGAGCSCDAGAQGARGQVALALTILAFFCTRRWRRRGRHGRS